MKRLCYGTFAKILLWGKSPSQTQVKLHEELLHLIDTEYINASDAQASRWFNCREAVSSSLQDEARKREREGGISEQFEKRIVKPLLNPNKLHTVVSAICEIIMEDNEINSDMVIDSINNISKKDLLQNGFPEHIVDFLASVLCFSIIHVDNREGRAFIQNGMSSFLKELNGRPKHIPKQLEPTAPELVSSELIPPTLPESIPDESLLPESSLHESPLPESSLHESLLPESSLHELMPTEPTQASQEYSDNNSHTEPTTESPPDAPRLNPRKLTFPKVITKFAKKLSKHKGNFAKVAGGLFIVTFAVVLWIFIRQEPEIVMVAAGFEHSLALHYDGTVWAWGGNNFGQLGDGTLLDRTEPVQVINLDSVIYIATGFYHSFAIREDGSLWAWGQNDFGQLGDGTTIKRNFPVQIMEGVSFVSGGHGHTIAVSSDGELLTWGDNEFGQLGDGTHTGRLIPQIIMDMNSVVNISAGQNHSLAIKYDGSLWAWGANNANQLGDGTNENRLNPIFIDIIEGTLKQVSGGTNHTLAVLEDGSLFAWGGNAEGQLGNDGNTNESRPTRIETIDSVTQVSAGGLHSMAVREDGSLWVWGNNSGGQLGTGDTARIYAPVQISNRVYDISAGKSNGHSLSTIGHTRFLQSSLQIWGTTIGTDNQTEMILTPTIVPVPSPQSHIAIDPPPPRIMISAGKTHSLVLTEDRVLWAWGANESGQLGDGGTYTYRENPAITMQSVMYISAGELHTLAIKTDGSLWAWGNNMIGQLGDGTTEHRTIPVRVMDSVIAVSAGAYHSLALDIHGNVWAWGDNAWEQLGVDTIYDRYTPVKILESIRAIYAGDTHSMAIDNYDNLWAWGDRFDSTPYIIMDSVSSVSTWYNHIMIIKTDGSLWALGYNQHGQLGNGTTINSYDPIKIMDDVESVSVGYAHTMAIRVLPTGERLLLAWGNNSYGQLGDGTTETRHYPIEVSRSVISVSAGGSHTLAVQPDGSILIAGQPMEFRPYTLVGELLHDPSHYGWSVLSLE